MNDILVLCNDSCTGSRADAMSPFALLEASTSITLVDPLPDELCIFVLYVELFDNKGESLDRANSADSLEDVAFWQSLTRKCLVLSP